MAAQAQRTRASIAPSSSRSRPSGPSNNLPTYQAPEFPLSVNAQRALAQLQQRLKLDRLEQAFTVAINSLTNNAADINERVQFRESQARRDHDKEDEDDSPDQVAELRTKVEGMTARMDESIRKVIDSQHALLEMRSSLSHIAQEALGNSASNSTITQTNHRSDEMDIDASAVSDFTPTAPNNASQQSFGAFNEYRETVEDARTRYQTHPLVHRYGQNEDYINFRTVVHDAMHPNDDVAMQPRSEWFQDGAAARPGITVHHTGDESDSSDDDIAISRAKISTRCPITLQEFQDPITSRKCPHTYEKNAILEMIARSEATVDGRGSRRGGTQSAQRSMRCPVGGCEQWLTRESLHVDPVISRKIKRLQRAKELEQEDGENAEDDDGAMELVGEGGDSNDDGADVDVLLASQT